VPKQYRQFTVAEKAGGGTLRKAMGSGCGSMVSGYRWLGQRSWPAARRPTVAGQTTVLGRGPDGNLWAGTAEENNGGTCGADGQVRLTS